MRLIYLLLSGLLLFAWVAQAQKVQHHTPKKTSTPFTGIKGAQVIHYGTAVTDSKWTASGDKMQCTLVHEIPNYGQVSFQQISGESIPLFSLNNWQGMNAGRAQISIIPEAWQRVKKPKSVIHFHFMPAGEPVILNAQASTLLLNELRNGYALEIKYPLSTLVVQLKVPAVNINKALGQFTKCVSELMTYQLKDIKETILYFPSGGSEIDMRQQQQLKRIIAYLQTKPKEVKRISIRCFVEPYGKINVNRSVARIRGEVLKQYFVQAKIDDKLIEIRAGNGAYRFKDAARGKEPRVGVVVIQLKQE